ncbi:hypothetical protein C2I36_06730 [Rhodobacteraceae bacterium WD3A24]|nr:hypothetical protein C2I36_06730 [Rhodobacteraceae bacterium WD3A24]
MSDPMSSREIEDVLSSIRRLVSRDTPPRPESAPQDRLVLTPALRVPDEAGGPSGDAVEPSVDGNGDPTQGEDELASLERTIADLEAAVAGRAEDWDPDGSEPRDTAAKTEGDEAAEAAPDKVHRLSPPSSAQAEAKRPEAEDDAATAESIRALLAGNAPQAPTSSTGAAEAVQAEPADSAPAAGTGTDTAGLDEDALRDLVARIVREELQGRLGERITRNVRKMVRAEIARALASRELD